ncbi:hypothetical protein G7Z17_g3457 [Cylindrodendrum hubeiense]|uniref:Helicase ATP-binding domain-containing protein n=1 Tax=Cylindrodendrum hubeiense TaxID=595255 RepID=A0A9P5LAR9_9HYPO|nr:hypothetical protein G7Z17_g3457 [Cylindrodendrum hubeiense]
MESHDPTSPRGTKRKLPFDTEPPANELCTTDSRHAAILNEVPALDNGNDERRATPVSSKFPHLDYASVKPTPRWHRGLSLGLLNRSPPLQKGRVHREERAKKWESLGYPHGVHFLSKWSSSVDNQALLAAYCHFKTTNELISFLDIVFPDVCQDAMLVLHDRFQLTTVKERLQPNCDTPPNYDTPTENQLRFRAFYRCVLNTINAITENATATGHTPKLPNPVHVIKAYENPDVKWVVDCVANGVSKPIFLPVAHRDVWPGTGSPHQASNTSSIIFILVHAVQVLLFAPINSKTPKSELCANQEAYPHRFPSPPGFGGNEDKDVAGLFSMEDLNRAVLLIFCQLKRRDGKHNLSSDSSPRNQSCTEFPGYLDQVSDSDNLDDEVDFDGVSTQAINNIRQLLRREVEPEEDLQDQRLHVATVGDASSVLSQQPLAGTDALDVHEAAMEQMSSVMAYRPRYKLKSKKTQPISHGELENALGVLKLRHRLDELVVTEAKTRSQLANLCIPTKEEELDTYIKKQHTSPVIQDFLKKHPEEIDKLDAEMKRQYALEHHVSSLQPDTRVDLNEVLSRHGLGPWPEMRLNDAPNIRPLLPHQLIDADRIVTKASTSFPHTFLSNDVGTGKTTTYLTVLVLWHRLQVKRFEEDKSIRFRPHLILTPVNSVHQTYDEARRQFPDLNLIVFYGNEETFPDKLASVYSTEELLNVLITLSNKQDDPKSGKTVVISTYTTWRWRMLNMKSKYFKWKPDTSVSASTDGGAQQEEDRGVHIDASHFHPRRTRIRRFAPEEVPADNVIWLTDVQREQADGNQVSYTHSETGLAHAHFDWLIADEAQVARNWAGSYRNMMRLLKWESLIWVTGTPLMSSFRDLLSPLSLMSKSLNCTWSPKGEEVGWGPGMYLDSYDPYTETNDNGEGKTTAGIFSQKYLDSHPEAQPLKNIYDMNKESVWILLPSLYSYCISRGISDINPIMDVVRPSLKKMHIMRTMRTPVSLPDGSTCYPSDGLLPATVIVEELEFAAGSETKQKMKELGQKYAKELVIFTEDHGGPSEAQAPQSRALLNFGKHREGVITAFDPRNVKVLESNRPSLYTGLRNLRRRRDQDPHLGVEHVQRIQRIQGDCLDYFLLYAEDGDVMRWHQDIGLLLWLATKNPLITRALDLCFDYIHKQKERVLVFVDTPWIQSLVCEILLLARFKVGTIRAHDSAKDRTRVIKMWNNPRSDMNVFVANFNTMATSVNMHTCCSKGIALSWHLNAKTMHHMVGRLNRIGQEGMVKFHLLKIKDTYHDNIERLNLLKWAPQLAAEIDLPSWIVDDARELVQRDVDKGHNEYHDEKTKRMGHISSCVAKLLVHCQDIDEDFWKSQVGQLASAIVRYTQWHDGGLAQLEEWLTYSIEKLRDVFMPEFRGFLDIAQDDDDDGVKNQVEMLRECAASRKEGKSDELVVNLDLEDGEASEDDEDQNPHDGQDPRNNHNSENEQNQGNHQGSGDRVPDADQGSSTDLAVHQ